MSTLECVLMCWQRSLEVAGKIKSILARLDRIRVLVDGMGGDIGLKQCMTLFE